MKDFSKDIEMLWNIVLLIPLLGSTSLEKIGSSLSVLDLHNFCEREGDQRERLPTPWLKELDPVAIGEGDIVSVGERAAMVVKLLVTSASPSLVWDIGGAIGNMVNLVLCAPAPHLFI
jgi:hypothetical protein